MNTSRRFTEQLLVKEEESWLTLTAADYDRILCELLDRIESESPQEGRDETLIALASTTLRRSISTAVESRARTAELLVKVGVEVLETAQRCRMQMLFLLAWLYLGSAAEHGPEFIDMTPPLPEGVVLPTGSDPDEIEDPVLREEAKENVRRHREEIERWNAKQRALESLSTLADLIRDFGPRFIEEDDRRQELLMAMSLAPGLPLKVKQQLEKLMG